LARQFESRDNSYVRRAGRHQIRTFGGHFEHQVK